MKLDDLKQARLPIFPFFLTLSALFALNAFLYYQVDMDDFFITMRYAVNIARGRGFVFNPGERVLGTTTPLFTLLIAFAVWIGIPALVAVRIYCSIFLFGASVFCWYYFREKGNELIGFSAGLLLFLLLPIKQLFGNEMPLCFFFILGSLYFYEQKNWRTSFVFQSLYALTRMEGLLFLFLLMALLFWRKRKIVYQALMPPLIILLPWFLFSGLYFGDLLPNTLYAKARQGARLDIWVSFARGLWNALQLIFFNAEWPFLSFCALIGLIPLLRTKHRLLLGWCVLHQLIYWFLNVPGSYKWYFYPLWLLYPLLLGGGIACLATGIRDFTSLKGRERLIYFALVGFLLSLAWRQPRLNTFSHARHRLYKNAANYIKDHWEPENKIIADEIGIFGYHLQEYTILDTAGLIHQNFPWEAYFYYSYLVKHYKPELIVNCRYPSDIEKEENSYEPIIVPIDEGIYLSYEVRRIFEGEEMMVRILEKEEGLIVTEEAAERLFENPAKGKVIDKRSEGR